MRGGRLLEVEYWLELWDELERLRSISIATRNERRVHICVTLFRLAFTGMRCTTNALELASTWLFDLCLNF